MGRVARLSGVAGINKIAKRSAYLLSALVLAFGAISTAIKPKHASAYGSGDGSSGSPYMITDCEELQAIDNESDTTGVYFRLANDIDCSMTNPSDPDFDGGGTWSSGNGFSSIGWSVTFFNGNFNGAGHTISGLYITGGNEAGLFSVLDSDAVITNLKLADFTIEASNGALGALAGRTETGPTISYVTVTDSSITGDSNYIGGLIGHTQSATISNVRVSATINANEYAAGIVGYSEQSTFSDCYFTGTIDSDNEEVGGIIGEMDDGSITNCHANVDITGISDETGGLVGEVETSDSASIDRSSSSGTVHSSGYVGGIIGEWEGDDVTVTNSFTTADIVSTGSFAGGFIGTAFFNRGVIRNSFSRGSVTGTNSVGGFSGDSSDEMDITNSYSTGEPTGSLRVAGFIGKITNGGTTITDSFWDKESSNQTVGCDITGDTCTGVTGKTTTQMKTLATFTDTSSPGLGSAWDFVNNPNNDSASENIWGIDPCINDGYPYLHITLSDMDTDGDGISDLTELSGPNCGDANNDSTPDVDQENVTSFYDPVSGDYSVLESSCNTLTSVEIGSEAAGDDSDVAFDYPVGLVGFTTECDNPGDTATITQYYFGDFDAPSFVLRKWDDTYVTVPGATITNETIDSQSALKVVYEIKDGGIYDQDITENGSIHDPSGPALNSVGSPDTGLGGLADRP